MITRRFVDGMTPRRMSYPWTNSGRRWTRPRPSLTLSTNYLPRSLLQLPIPLVPPSSVHDHAPPLRPRRLRSHIIPTPSPLRYPRPRPYRRTPWRCEKRSPVRATTTTQGAAVADVSSCDVLLRLGLSAPPLAPLASGHVVRDSLTLRLFSCTILLLTAFSVFPPPAWIPHAHLQSSRSVLSVQRVFHPPALIVLPRLC